MKTTHLEGDVSTPDNQRADVVLLGIDVHLNSYVVVRQIDGWTPQPAQRFSPAKFLQWARKQVAGSGKVHGCYEAGPFGYGLHRELERMGVSNHVIRPQSWDTFGKHVKTDKRDAREMVLQLDRYVRGNRNALSVVRVPALETERARSLARQREAFRKESNRLAAQGRGHGLCYGHRVGGQWWKLARWEALNATAPEHLCALLEPLRRLIDAVEAELKRATKDLENACQTTNAAGVGAMTAEILDREIGDWNRFDNRRQVASYTGMCPRESSSAERRIRGSINKHGNGRIRHVLVECAWRLLHYQPGYRGVRKWADGLADPKTGAGRRKQIIVAIAREFAVDWWRVRTGRCSAQDLGLLMNTN